MAFIRYFQLGESLIPRLLIDFDKIVKYRMGKFYVVLKQMVTEISNIAMKRRF